MQPRDPGPDQMAVTVVVPMYNSEATIVRCLESIRAQSKPAAKVIVVDDASFDRSAEAVSTAGLANMELFSLVENRGPGAARNLGAAQATSEWIAFLDADNVWEPTFLEEVCAAIAGTGADFGSSGGIRIKTVGRPTTSLRLLSGPPEETVRSADFWRVTLRFLPVVPSSMVVRRALFEQVGGFPEDVRTGEDISLTARLWLFGRFAFVNQPLYTSVQLSTSLSAGERTYHDVRKLLTRVGQTLWHSIRARRAGTGWFIVAFARMVVGRHAAWLALRLRRGAGGIRPGRRAVSRRV